MRAAQRKAPAPEATGNGGGKEHWTALDHNSSSAAGVAHALGGKANGSGYSAHCPAHDDRNPSLSISDGDCGILVHCHAGCDQDAVIEALRGRGLWPEQHSDINHPKLGEPDTVWTYRDQRGQTLGHVCRWETPQSKDIRPYVNGSWRGFEKPRPLYGLDRLASNPDSTVIVCEGEKAADAAQEIMGGDYVCMTWPGGTGGVNCADWSPLQGRTVYVWPDNDAPGRKAAKAIIRHVSGAQIMRAPEDRGEGWDAADARVEGVTDDDVRSWMPAESAQDMPGSGDAQDTRKQSGDDDGQERKSAATTLVEIAEELYRFGVSTDGETFAVPRSGSQVVATLRGNRNSLRGQIARTYFRRTGKAAPQQALADALLVIDGMAQEAEPEDLHLRVAEAYGAQWLDLGDTTGRAVKVTADGWHVVDTPPVLFKRSALTSALPEPERGGSLDQLWHLLNVAESDHPLVAAWLVSLLYQRIAHPVLSFFGEQGTGKTTAGRHVVSTIDPSPVPTRKPPRDADSWVTAAAGSWVVGLDNLSTVPDWLSDSICRAVTGDGDVRRKLYTDGEHQVFAYRRCIIVNGIDLGGTRGDLAERMLPINLEQISEQERRGDNEIGADWDAAHARILGAVLDLAASVASLLPSVRLESKPRMADFARILAAVDECLGTDGLDHYIGKQRSLATDSLTADPFVQAMQVNLADGFTGTAAELLDRLTVDHPPKGWPTQPRQVTQRLRRQAPSMRKAGWDVTDDGGANHRNTTTWTIYPPRPELARKSASPDSQTRGGTGSASHASLASLAYRETQDGRCPACDGEGCGHCGDTGRNPNHV